MEILIIIIVCFFSSVVGAICGIGGGVIIKPVLDATGIMEVATASFLSGCTVLSMSVVSFYKNVKGGAKNYFDKMFACTLALGSVLGGIAGKSMFQKITEGLNNKNTIGAIQATVLLFITIGTLVYCINKNRIITKKVKSKGVVFLIGIILGIMSSFLGIGGGPINLIVLYFCFSMETKVAALYSIFIILFSQISSLLSTIVSGKIPEFAIEELILMVTCGILGGIVGAKINKKLTNCVVDKLFLGLILIIIFVNIYNIFRYT